MAKRPKPKRKTKKVVRRAERLVTELDPQTGRDRSLTKIQMTASFDHAECAVAIALAFRLADRIREGLPVPKRPPRCSVRARVPCSPAPFFLQRRHRSGVLPAG